MTQAIESPPSTVVAAFALDPQSVQSLSGGLINRSYVAYRDSQPVVLQRVSDIFGPGLNEDLDAVTAHLASRGLVTPRLVPTRDGQLTVVHEAGRWRLWDYIPGVSVDVIRTPGQARSAGRLVAEFHRALSNCEHVFQSTRLGIHDTAAHLQQLGDTLARHPDHPAHARIQGLAQDIVTLFKRTAPLPTTAERIVHGDLKISNVVFDQASDEAVCLIDLDTVGPMALPLELGDAMRSWCNPYPEDAGDARFDMGIFKAAMAGYAGAAAGFITEAEWRAILPATLIIALELAARFAADALTENYFGWDPARFASASEHNQVRAAGQLQLARSIFDQFNEAAAVLATLFNPPGAPAAS